MTRRIPEMNLEKKLETADYRAVRSALPARSVLAEFVRFEVFDFGAVVARGDARWKPARYAVFIVPSEQTSRIRMIDLGDATTIDGFISEARSTIVAGGERRPQRSTLERLRRAVFDPLCPEMNGVTRLFVVPDGDIALFPFEVLPGQGEVDSLIESYQISYLASGRDALNIRADAERPSAPVVIADPDFDLGSTIPSGKEPPGRRSRASAIASMHFGRLPGTRTEGMQIARMLSTRLGAAILPWLDSAALESRVKELKSPWILHVATHGFFLADQPASLGQRLRDLGAIEWPSGEALFSPDPLFENPLLRSGLALAGANWKSKGFTPPSEAEDGLLTAEDVAGLDLLSTELVVLSACETGLGEVRIGEGVFGLRRTFALCGAKTLVMSLWKVPDAETQELMEDFYRRVLAGEARAEALRQSQLGVKRKRPEPVFWGAFICQGDPGPMNSPTANL